MVTRKEDTPQRVANRKYEAKNKEKRQAASGNFQTMIPRELFTIAPLPCLSKHTLRSSALPP